MGGVLLAEPKNSLAVVVNDIQMCDRRGEAAAELASEM
jgi:hypothetical protein